MTLQDGGDIFHAYNSVKLGRQGHSEVVLEPGAVRTENPSAKREPVGWDEWDASPTSLPVHYKH